MQPDPLEIMAVDGGYRATDSYQVFPKISKDGQMTVSNRGSSCTDGGIRMMRPERGWRNWRPENL